MKRDLQIAIAASRFNEELTLRLLKCCKDELFHQGLKFQQIKTYWVPGAYELPYMALKLAKSKKFDAIICLGCIIKGSTLHDHYVATWATLGIGQASLQTGVPVLYGVLTPTNETQARQRVRPGPLNRGKEVARAAIEMIQISKRKVH